MWAWGRTWRVERVREAAFTEPVIYAFWHARMLPLVWAHRGGGAAVLVSRHADGELIARLIERLGFVTARGSSTRGGEEGLREMVARLEEGRAAGVTPDGPRGPARVAKSGVAYLAGRTGRLVVPLGAAAARGRTLGSWDGFRVPAPFTRVVLVYGAPLRVPPAPDAATLAEWSQRIGAAIDAVTARADAMAGARP